MPSQITEHEAQQPAIVDAQKGALATSRARELQWMFFDVDGVLTDGGLFYGQAGESFKRFHVMDGHGLKMLRAAGVKIGIISGRQHPSVDVRARELGFDLVVQGASDKAVAFEALITRHQLQPALCGHMGDDTPDLALFGRVGFTASVPNAVPELRAAAMWVSSLAGGHGAVRECCDFILGCRK